MQPLEASLAASGQTVDGERERTYALAESLDGQLARMCGDLKEVDDFKRLTTLVDLEKDGDKSNYRPFYCLKRNL